MHQPSEQRNSDSREQPSPPSGESYSNDPSHTAPLPEDNDGINLAGNSLPSEHRKQSNMNEQLPQTEAEARTETENPSPARSQRSPNKMMQMVSWLLDRAEKSGLALFVLNQAFLRAIPFNRPHGIKIKSVKPDEIRAELPYKKKNFNHLRGLHACALATASEFASGVLLSRYLDPGKYRIIMDNMKVSYHYQGKSSATAVCKLDQETINEKVLKPIEENDAAVFEMEANTYDAKNNHLSTATIVWHVKPWEKVRTRV